MLRNQRDGPAGFFNLHFRAFGEAMRRNLERFAHLAVTEHHNVVLGLLDNAAMVQHLWRDFIVGRKRFFQRFETDLDPLLLENIRKATLRQPAMKRHLAAFESRLRGIAGARLLALFTAPGSFAEARPWSATEALFLVRRSFGRA